MSIISRPQYTAVHSEIGGGEQVKRNDLLFRPMLTVVFSAMKMKRRP